MYSQFIVTHKFKQFIHAQGYHIYKHTNPQWDKDKKATHLDPEDR